MLFALLMTLRPGLKSFSFSKSSIMVFFLNFCYFGKCRGALLSFVRAAKGALFFLYGRIWAPSYPNALLYLFPST